jgi:transloator
MAGSVSLDPSARLAQYQTQVDNKGQVGATKTGSGVSAASGPAPASASTATQSAVMASLQAMMPKMTGEQMDVMILSIVTKMKDTIDATEKDKVKVDQGTKRANLLEKQNKIEEADKKIQEAKDARENASVWDKIKLAFQYIGAILTILAGVALMAAATATGVGVAAGLIGGGMMVGAGIAMLALAADATYAQTNGGIGFVGEIVKQAKMAGGASQEEAEKAARTGDMVARIVIGVGAAVAAIAGGAVAGIGAFVGAASSGAAIASTAAQTAQKVMDIVMALLSAGTTIASSTGDAATAGVKYKASQTEAEGKKLQGDAKTLEALNQTLDDMIDQALARLKGAGERFDAMLDSLVDAAKDRGDTLARASFRG